MKRIVLLILLSIVLVICAGCGKTEKPPSIDAIEVPHYGYVEIADNGFAIVGDLEIKGYEAGYDMREDAEKHFDRLTPMYIVNRINSAEQKGTLKTEVNETSADIPLNHYLHNNDLSSVTITCYEVIIIGNQYKVTDKIADEHPIATGISGKTLSLINLKPEHVRGIKITYTPDIVFSVTPIYSSYVPEADVAKGFIEAPPYVTNWITLDKTEYVVAPDSYTPIWTLIHVPEGVELPDKWVFWLRISVGNIGERGGISQRIEQQWSVKVITR